jgi:hypothetical protein
MERAVNRRFVRRSRLWLALAAAVALAAFALEAGLLRAARLA